MLKLKNLHRLEVCSGRPYFTCFIKAIELKEKRLKNGFLNPKMLNLYKTNQMLKIIKKRYIF